jgi:hypothetical protein
MANDNIYLAFLEVWPQSPPRARTEARPRLRIPVNLQPFGQTDIRAEPSRTVLPH